MGKDFTPTVHHDVYPGIAPHSGTLSPPFTVCITGASRGIGAHIAYAFAQAGASAIAVCSLTVEEVEISEIPSKVASINPSIKVDPSQSQVRIVENLYARSLHIITGLEFVAYALLAS